MSMYMYVFISQQIEALVYVFFFYWLQSLKKENKRIISINKIVYCTIHLLFLSHRCRHIIEVMPTMTLQTQTQLFDLRCAHVFILLFSYTEDKVTEGLNLVIIVYKQ